MKDAKLNVERLVRMHRNAVYRQMVRVCSNQDDAEDALAQAVLQAFQAADQLREDQNFRAWLGTIARRVCAKMRGNDRLRNALQYAEDHDLIPEQSDEMELAVMKGCIREAVDALSDTYRDIYVMCDIQGMGVEEAARKLGITHAAAKSRLLRARGIIAHELDGSICGR